MSLFEKLFGRQPLATQDPNFSAALERVENALSVVTEKEGTFLACTALLMAQVAHVDSEISESEKERIYQVLRKQMKLSEEKAVAATSVAVEHALTLSIDRHIVMRKLNESATHDQKHDLIRALFEVATDEDITEAESDEIGSLANALHLPRPEFTAIRAEYREHRSILKGLKKK